MTSGPGAGASDRIKIGYVAGIIPTKNILKFQRTIHRITRGNILMNTYPFDNEAIQQLAQYVSDDNEKKMQSRSLVFLIYSEGLSTGQSTMATKNINSQIQTLCKNFDIITGYVPKTNEEIEQALTDLQENVVRLKEIREESNKHILETLESLSSGESPESLVVRKYPKDEPGFSFIDEFSLLAIKETAIYTHMNYFIHKQPLLVGCFWAPSSRAHQITSELNKLYETNQNFVGVEIRKLLDPVEEPPTFFDTNDFTRPFQEIVDTYGVPRYKEINPAYFTVVTFPFEFGVMFGDLGHGLMLFLASLWMCGNKSLMREGSAAVIFNYRFLLLFMGFFACYGGLIYNDFISLKLLFGPSCYETGDRATSQHGPGAEPGIYERKDGSCTYGFGFDWIWGNCFFSDGL
jgi:V-type H+-transporting ATPase subunit a